MTVEESSTLTSADTKAAAPTGVDVDLDAVQERLAFFFSAANIRQDNFLRKFLTSSSTHHRGSRQGEDDTKHPHMIPVATLLRFNTLSKLTKDPAIVVQVASSPPLSDRLVVSEDQTAIGLRTPWSDEQMDDNVPLSLVVEQLPLVEETPEEGTPDEQVNHKRMKYVHTTDQVKDLFAQYGKVALCRLRFKRVFQDNKSTDKKSRRFLQEPLGIAFVEFESQTDCDTAAADTLTVENGEPKTPKRELKLGDAVLTVRTLKDYIEERKALNAQDESDANKSKKRSRDHGDDGAEDEEAKSFTLDWKPGCVIRLEGLADSCDREAILAAVAQGLDMTVDQVKDQKVYADYSRGQTDGAIRFMEPEKVADLCAKLASGDLPIAGGKVNVAKILEGEEEQKYWDDFIAFKNKQLSHKREEKAHRKKRHFKR